MHPRDGAGRKRRRLEKFKWLMERELARFLIADAPVRASFIVPRPPKKTKAPAARQPPGRIPTTPFTSNAIIPQVPPDCK